MSADTKCRTSFLEIFETFGRENLAFLFLYTAALEILCAFLVDTFECQYMQTLKADTTRFLIKWMLCFHILISSNWLKPAVFLRGFPISVG